MAAATIEPELRPDAEAFAAAHCTVAAAIVALYAGRLDAADMHAAALPVRAPMFPVCLAAGLGVRAQVALRRGLRDDAVALARQGLALAAQTGADLYTRTLLHHALALGLRSDDALEAARERLRAIARALRSEERAATFLAAPENAATMDGTLIPG